MVKKKKKKTLANAGDMGSIPGSGRPPGEGNGNPLRYSCLENPMDGGAGGLQPVGSQSCSQWLNSSHDTPFWVALGKHALGDHSVCILQLPRGPHVFLPSQLQQVHQWWDSAPALGLQWDGRPGRLSVCVALPLCAHFLSHGPRDQRLTSSAPCHLPSH